MEEGLIFLESGRKLERQSRNLAKFSTEGIWIFRRRTFRVKQ